MSDRRERRLSGRFNLWFYLDFYRETGDNKCAGICYDISTTGMMIGSSEKLVVGENLHLRFRVMPEHFNDAAVSASPIRVLENPYDTTGTWPHLSAIQFDEPFPELEPLLQIAAQSDKVKR
ncbi:MAG: PilZ domain-containing protein [Myxococcales bacterium]|nr:MAG: PilZ domain-containing protein [Myxococcales bacterium]